MTFLLASGFLLVKIPFFTTFINPMTTAESLAPASKEQPSYILIVEDDVLQRSSLAEWLRLQNHVVYESSSTDAAALLLSSPLLHIDLVITDIWLPGIMSGSNFVEYIRYRFPTMPVIIISGVFNKAPLDAHTAFFQKPYNLDDISLQITKMIESIKEE